MSSSKSRPAKRQRTFGAPTKDDNPGTEFAYKLPTDAVSTRDISSRGVPSLATLCARVFVQHIKRFAEDEDLWTPIREWLKIIPDPMVPKLFAMLRASCPTYLSHAFISTNFLRGPSITLTNELTGVTRHTIEAVARAAQTLRELHLIGFDKFSDDTFASVVSRLPSLQVLVLRGCTKVSVNTIEAAAQGCRQLATVNFGYTSATPASVASLVLACTDLQVLKLAGVQNWTDANFSKFLSALPQDQFTLPKLRKLKLRQTSLSDVSISAFLLICPNLESLDISFTLVKSPLKNIDLEAHPVPLQKLNITSTSVSGAELAATLPHLPLLRTLSIGALGSRQGSTLSISNSSAMTLTEDDLIAITTTLATFEHVENINLVGNTKLCLVSKHAVPDFIRLVGRRCKKLNLAGMPALRSRDLAGLLPSDEDPNPSSLEILVLNNTSVDDDAASFIGCCPQLKSLEVVGTKFTSDGLFDIIDTCPQLATMDLSSCRGVRVRDRRHFFERWAEERNI